MFSPRRGTLPALVLSLLAGCASASPPAACPAPPANTASHLRQLDSQQLAKRMIEAMVGDNLAEQALESMMSRLREIPGLPPGFVDRFRCNANFHDLEALLVPIYAKVYERETMIAATEFYESEQGRRFVRDEPEANRLGMEAGHRWTRDAAEKTLKDMGIAPPAAQAP